MAENRIILVTTNGLLARVSCQTFDTRFILTERSKRNPDQSIRRCLAVGKVT